MKCCILQALLFAMFLSVWFFFFVCVYEFFASHVHVYAICVESVQKPTEISQIIIARLSLCALGVRNSGRAQANAGVT